MKKNVVSVGVITYNHGPYIRQCLLNILNQKTDFQVEIVVGEDCSTDNTRQEIQKLIGEFPNRITPIFHDTNVGAMRNGYDFVMPKCDGEFVALCEGDDFWCDEKKLQQQINFLKSHPDCALTCHDAQVVDENGQVVVPSRLKPAEKRDLTSDELQRGEYVLALTMCFKNKVRNFPTELYSTPNGDLFLCVLLGAHGYCHFHPEILPAAYRTHTGGIWSLQNTLHRQKLAIASYFQIAHYLKRIGNEKYHAHYANWYIEKQFLLFTNYWKGGEQKNAFKLIKPVLTYSYRHFGWKRFKHSFIHFLRLMYYLIFKQ